MFAVLSILAQYGNPGGGSSGGGGYSSGGGYSAGYWIVVGVIAAVVVALIVGAIWWFRSRRTAPQPRGATPGSAPPDPPGVTDERS